MNKSLRFPEGLMKAEVIELAEKERIPLEIGPNAITYTLQAGNSSCTKWLFTLRLENDVVVSSMCV